MAAAQTPTPSTRDRTGSGSALDLTAIAIGILAATIVFGGPAVAVACLRANGWV